MSAGGTSSSQNQNVRGGVAIVHSADYAKLCNQSTKFKDRYSIVIDLIESCGLMSKMARIKPPRYDEQEDDISLAKFNTHIRPILTGFHSAEYIDAVCRLSQEFFTGSNDENEVDDEDRGEELLLNVKSCKRQKLEAAQKVDIEKSKMCAQHENERVAQLASFSKTWNAERFGLAYDCCGFPGLLSYAVQSVLGSMTAVNHLLRENHAQIAINWGGGWHHAHRAEAAGFCFFNDVVLAALRLQTGLRQHATALTSHRSSPSPSLTPSPPPPLVIVFDLDLHHGDATEEAFLATPSVLTVSLHHWAPWFFPNGPTGNRVVSGIARGINSSINIPLPESMNDELYMEVFDRVLEKLVVSRLLGGAAAVSAWPGAVIVQCGADCLATDPFKVFNLTERAYQHCVWRLFETFPRAKFLLLGGGGYHFADTAKLWTRLTALAIAWSAEQREKTANNANKNAELPSSPKSSSFALPNDIPESSEYFHLYGPSFETVVFASNRKPPNREEFWPRIQREIDVALELRPDDVVDDDKDKNSNDQQGL